jgi:hypothetical protein
MTRKRDLQQLLSRSTLQAGARPDVAAEQDRLNRAFETVRDQYATLLSKRENLKLQDQVISTTDTVSFRVIDPPSSPRRPALPDRPMLLVMVALLAMAGGVGAALIRSLILRAFPTAQRLEMATGLPVIGLVPDAGVLRNKPQRTREDRYFRLAISLLFSALALLIVIDEAQRSILA